LKKPGTVTTIQEAWENDKSLSLDKYEAGSWGPSIRRITSPGHAWISNTDNEEEEEEEENKNKKK
jgi:hypothetical protein